jgi:hypothetical protein
MNTKLLGIYMNDHLAGSMAGLELAKRAASSNEGTRLGDFLEGLVIEIESDRETLKAMMDHLGIGQDRIKVPAAWAAEKVGRLKPNGQLTGYSPLSRLIELEGLALGVTGKLGLWRALAATSEDLGSFDLEGLIDRARKQRDGLERHRVQAAQDAFAEPVPAEA